MSDDENVQSAVKVSVPVPLMLTSVNTTTPGGTLLNVKVGRVVVTCGGVVTGGMTGSPPPPQADSPATRANAATALEMRVDIVLLDMALPLPSRNGRHPIRGAGTCFRNLCCR